MGIKELGVRIRSPSAPTSDISHHKRRVGILSIKVVKKWVSVVQKFSLVSWSGLSTGTNWVALLGIHDRRKPKNQGSKGGV